MLCLPFANRQQIDWPGIRAAAIALNSVRLAATKASQHLSSDEQRRFVERVNKRAYRERWLDEAKVLFKPRDNGSLPLSKPVQTGANTLTTALADESDATRICLSRANRKAAETFAGMSGEKLARGETARALKDHGNGAALVHGWNLEKGKAEIGLTLNLLNLASGNA